FLTEPNFIDPNSLYRRTKFIQKYKEELKKIPKQQLDQFLEIAKKMEKEISRMPDSLSKTQPDNNIDFWHSQEECSKHHLLHMLIENIEEEYGEFIASHAIAMLTLKGQIGKKTLKYSLGIHSKPSDTRPLNQIKPNEKAPVAFHKDIVDYYIRALNRPEFAKKLDEAIEVVEEELERRSGH
ncbi:MAG: hypothetical protein VXZ72_05535, partial [Chlamydiota bacterium]|nr:hypothetical protein [Chlamydiota bacterium]